MNWTAFLLKLPMVIGGIVGIVERVKASGPDKKAAVMAALPESIALVDFAAGKDLLNDHAIAQLVSALVDAEAAVFKARDALKQGLLAKAST